MVSASKIKCVEEIILIDLIHDIVNSGKGLLSGSVAIR